MINVSFYLLTPKAKNFSSLYVSIISAGERLRFPTGEKLPAEFCQIRKKKGKELLKKNTTFYFEYDAKLKDLKQLFYQIAQDLKKKFSRLATPEEIKAEYHLRTKQQLHDEDIFITLFVQFMNSGTIKNANSEGSMNFFNALHTHLVNYQVYKEKKISFGMVNTEFWESIKTYFSRKLGFSNNTSNNYLKRLRRFLHYAVEEGYLEAKIPVKKFKNFEELHTDDMPLVALDQIELEKIFTLDLKNDREQELVRDQFLVECYTGQRYSDLENVLNSIDLAKDSVTINQIKTKTRVSIPITEKLRQQIVRIKDRYQGVSIPILNNALFNKHLKYIGQLAELNTEVRVLKLSGKIRKETTLLKWQLLGSHTGRRTFCTYALQKGIEAELIMRVTGHKTYVSFRKYLRLNDQMTLKEFQEKFI